MRPQRLPLHADRMKRLSAIAALLLAGPLSAFAPAKADWVNAETRPDLKHLWTPAPAFPFQTNPGGFKAQIEKEAGIRVLEMQGCELKPHPARFYETSFRSWSPDSKWYSCEQVFFEKSDPRGTQRCMGRFQWKVQGTAPMGNGESFTRQSAMSQKTLKNDCRWL